MTNRREFLQIGLAGAAIVPLAAFGRPAYAPAASPLYKAIFDERFPASIAFALELNRRGIPIHGIRGDITALWYHDLYFQWRGGPVAIAGMTTNESLFCLEVLGRDAGLRVTDRRAIADGLVSWSMRPRGDNSATE